AGGGATRRSGKKSDSRLTLALGSGAAVPDWRSDDVLSAGERDRPSPLWLTEFWVQQQKCCDADDNESHDKHRHPIVHFPLPSLSMTVEGRANDHQCVL